MARYLFIVARDQPELFRYVSESLAGADEIQVIRDRRQGERRAAPGPHTPERRQGERRIRLHIDEQLGFVGYAVVQAE